MLSDTTTQAWREYERGKEYIQNLRIKEETDEAYRFFEGDQWRGLKDGGERLPMWDVISPDVNYKVAVVTQNLMEIHFSPMNYDDPDFQLEAERICEQLNAHAKRMWENESMDDVCFEIIEDACISRAKYIVFDYVYGEELKAAGVTKRKPGHMEHYLLDSANIMFADEQERDIQKQPYISIPRRRRVVDVREEAKKNGIPQKEIDLIVSDEDKGLETGDRAVTEVGKDNTLADSGKCLCIVKFWKKGGTIWKTESTKNVTYKKPVDLGLKRYPIAGYVWSRVKGTCRGQGAVNKMVPAQIIINRLIAYRYLNAKMTGLAKPVYNTDIIPNGSQVLEFGTAIEVQGGMDMTNNIMNSIGYLQPAQTGSDVKGVTDDIIAGVKNAGVTNLSPDEISSNNIAFQTVLAIKENNEAPLNKQTIKYKRFIEDIARIYFDFWVNYEDEGLSVVEKQKVSIPSKDGQPEEAEVEIAQTIPKEILEKLKPQIKVDITPTSPYNKLVEQQKLDNVYAQGAISFAEYVEALPDSEPSKKKFQKIVESQAVMQRLQESLQLLVQENEQLKQQNAADNEVLVQAGEALDKTAQAGEQNKKAAYDKGQIDAIAKINGGK